MSTLARWRQGAWTAFAVVLGLVFIPPMVADKLDGWDAATNLLAKNQQLIETCGADVRVDLSRWFYTYRFSGENAQARFSGQAMSKTCHLRFAVHLRREDGEWKVTELSLR